MDARFAIASRHSRMVRMLRVTVPATVILSMTAIVFVSVYNPFRMLLPKLPVDMGNLVVSGTKITMETPHMSGYTPDQRPYEVWAKTATQDLNDPDHLELKTLKAKVLMEDRTTTIIMEGNRRLPNLLLDKAAWHSCSALWGRTCNPETSRARSRLTPRSSRICSSWEAISLRAERHCPAASVCRLEVGLGAICFPLFAPAKASSMYQSACR